jgi:DNA-directed RNA polymerase specialized sigma24 family protein
VAFCTQATGSAHLGEELCQEALTRVYARYPLLREPRPYVFKVASQPRPAVVA